MQTLTTHLGRARHMRSGFVTQGNAQAAIGESGLCGRNELLAEESIRQGEEETALSRFYVGEMGMGTGGRLSLNLILLSPCWPNFRTFFLKTEQIMGRRFFW